MMLKQKEVELPSQETKHAKVWCAGTAVRGPVKPDIVI